MHTPRRQATRMCDTYLNWINEGLLYPNEIYECDNHKRILYQIINRKPPLSQLHTTRTDVCPLITSMKYLSKGENSCATKEWEATHLRKWKLIFSVVLPKTLDMNEISRWRSFISTNKATSNEIVRHMRQAARLCDTCDKQRDCAVSFINANAITVCLYRIINRKRPWSQQHIIQPFILKAKEEKS
jgi:hypothetical protein